MLMARTSVQELEDFKKVSSSGEARNQMAGRWRAVNREMRLFFAPGGAGDQTDLASGGNWSSENSCFLIVQEKEDRHFRESRRERYSWAKTQ